MEEKTCYSVPNPYFLSDRFVYAHHKELGTVYIKLNCSEEIEEIGVDIVKRMHSTPLDKIKELRGCREAYKQGKIAYVREIADNYYKDGKITKEVYDALYRYEPKFKD